MQLNGRTLVVSVACMVVVTLYSLSELGNLVGPSSSPLRHDLLAKPNVEDTGASPQAEAPSKAPGKRHIEA